MIENKITAFKNHLFQLGYTKSSCYMLPLCVESFLNHTGKQETAALSTADVHAFYEWLHQRPNKRKAGGLSEQYIHHHVYGLKLFFNYLQESGAIKSNPMSVLKFPSPERKQRNPLSKLEIQTLFVTARTMKEKALLHLFYSCGLRRSEGEMLNIADVHFKKQVLYVRVGKGNKRRAVPMPYSVARDLESYYLNERTKEKEVRDEAAFILNKSGTRLRGSGYNDLLKQLLQKAEMHQEVSLHHLRHSIATHLLESGLSIEKVKDFLGHSHLESTQGYVKVNQKQLNTL